MKSHTAFHIVVLVIAASYNTTLVVKSALGSYLGATDYYTRWSEANENLDAIYRDDQKVGSEVA